jgi:hypothetical protein
MLGKLLAVVQREGLPQDLGCGRIAFGGGLADGRRLQVGDLGQQQVSRFSLHERYRSATAMGTYDRIPLPVAEATATIDDRGASLDAHAGRQPPPVFPVWPLSPQTSQMTLPVFAHGLLGTNPGVDRLVRNLPPPIAGKIATRASFDLVGRPSPTQPLSDILMHVRSIHLGHPRPPTPASLGLPLGSHRPVAVAAAVTSQFAGDRAFVAAQSLGDSSQRVSVAVHLGYDLTLFHGKMTCHRGNSFRMGPPGKSPLKRPRDVFTNTSFP